MVNVNCLNKFLIIENQFRYYVCHAMFQNNSNIVMPYFYHYREATSLQLDRSGNTIGGSITVPLTSCLTRLESAV
jgi:hypothetical protein